MTKISRTKSLFLVCAVFWTCCLGAQNQPAERDAGAQSQASASAPQFRPVAGAPEGTREATVFALGLPRVHSRLEIRTILVPAGKPVTLAAENEAVFEIRAGSASDLSEGKSRKLQRGEVWHVSKGARITLQAAEELAVVRALYLIPGEN